VPAERDESLPTTLLDVPDLAICHLSLSECSEHTHKCGGWPEGVGQPHEWLPETGQTVATSVRHHVEETAWKGRHRHERSRNCRVAPWIVTRDTGKLLDFIVAAFEGEELARVPLEDGSIGHAEIRVGDTVLLAFDRRPDWPDLPSLLRVFVDDADAATKRAVAAGGRIDTSPSTQAFGHRGGRVRDPFGNIWWISAVVEDVAPEEGMRRLAEPAYAEAMGEAQETLDSELSGRGHGTSSGPIVP
jgi:PhnB protein